MSIWKSIGKAVSNVASGFVDSLGGGLAGSAIGMVDNYFQNKQNEKNWQKQTSWQEKMTKQQNEFNANEALLNRQFNASEAEKSRQFNASEAEKAHQRNIAMFNMENQYNSPKAQLQRMREAGMNPALMNGGSLVAASASPAPAASGSSASGSSASGSAPASPTLQNPLSIAQYRLMNEQAQSLALDNREKRNDLNAKEKPLDSLHDVFRTETNEDGSKSYIVVKQPPTNYWEEMRDKERVSITAQSLANDEKQLSFDILKATKDMIVEGKRAEVATLLKKLALLKNEEEVSNFKTNLVKKYGISADADWLNNIITMVLSNPENASNVLNSVFSTMYSFMLNHARNTKNLPSAFMKYIGDIYDIFSE